MEEYNNKITFNTGFKAGVFNNIQKKKENSDKSVFLKY
jgi:hypothetical protein